MARRAVKPKWLYTDDSIEQVDPTEAAVGALMHDGEIARNDLSKFYSFVIKHELTKELLTPAPHQELMFNFMLHHYWCVIRIPVGCAKTFSMTAAAKWFIGKDITQRWAILSKTQKQAQKPLSMVSDYIEDDNLNARLILVFPWLKKSLRAKDKWTMNEITIDRPPGIRDSTLMAAGLETKVSGARLSGMLCDDLVDDENSFTPDQRDLTCSRFEGRFLSRMDPKKSRVIVTNTPWHKDDLTYYLEKKAGWPTITMDIYGNIRVTNVDASWLRTALDLYIRRSEKREKGWYRLIAHDPDPKEETPLWPDRYSLREINEIRYGTDGTGGYLPHEFARLFLCQPMDESAVRCHKDWTEKCKYLGLGMTLASSYNGVNKTITGIDLAVGKKRKFHDETTYFTFEILPDNTKVVLDIESGQYKGPTIREKAISKAKAYNSVLYVENNGAQQYILDFIEEKDKGIVVKSHSTQGSNKRDIDFGVESTFGEIKSEGWIIPCDRYGVCHPEVQKWIDEMVGYQPPPAHPGDRLMACWIAREGARKSYVYNDPKPKRGKSLVMSKTGGY